MLDGIDADLEGRRLVGHQHPLRLNWAAHIAQRASLHHIVTSATDKASIDNYARLTGRYPPIPPIGDRTTIPAAKSARIGPRSNILDPAPGLGWWRDSRSTHDGPSSRIAVAARHGAAQRLRHFDGERSGPGAGGRCRAA